jgi:hypothetical protein
MRDRGLVGIALGMALAAAPLGAQRPLTVGLAGGVSLPQGAFGDGAETGWHGLATFALGSPMQPLGLRLDGAYNQFGFKGAAAAATSGARQTITSGTLNVSYRLPAWRTPFSPYLIAGGGAYHLACSGGASCGATTKFGWNAGLGTKLTGLGLRTFVEARFHSVAEPGPNVRYFPVTLGLLF